ncbi:VP4 [Lebombo virus]|uniref:Core protein VP4 n=1 Tax=Lebombo virus TaxID=40057 RepID=W5QLW5_9REOV|nr:VP4 [Lebombo virus]AFX73379.1 VP4 [Lebombo virus]
MVEPHAVIYLTAEFEPLLHECYIDVWRLKGNETLNDVWLENGRFSSDVYALGPIVKWTIRQLRAHRFLFVSTSKKIRVKDCEIAPDVYITRETLLKGMKAVETEIGRKRVRLRKSFGDVLRTYALRNAVVLHGSEAETLMVADPKVHQVYGLPREIPNDMQPDKTWTDADDSPTDEKLVSMLDYMIYSAEEVHYVGAGDGRTLAEFKKRDPNRFRRVQWYCYDPIFKMEDVNVHGLRKLVRTSKDIELTPGRKDRVLLWDVSADSENRADPRAWERERLLEDERGACIALALRTDFSLACVKFRIPNRRTVVLPTSMIIPQPGAHEMMYECRNIMRLEGFSRVNREHLPTVVTRDIDCDALRGMVRNYHGRWRGRVLKRVIFEGLHIMKQNGLDWEGELPRSDLFYMTNRANVGREVDIERVARESVISTVWTSALQNFDYDDFKVHRNKLMFWNVGNDRLIFDGNGLMLFLMWRYPGICKKTVNYDPCWAERYGAVIQEAIPEPPIPELSLCRFVGLRKQSSWLRLNASRAHYKSDEVKQLGLDLSGHLYIALMSEGYVADLRWWFRMILEWSAQDRAKKIADLAKLNGEVIEWKEEKASEPWHKREDLIAALRAFISFSPYHLVPVASIIRHLDGLRNA